MKKDYNKGELIIYESKDGQADIQVKLEGETVWLNLMQLTQLFKRDKSVISRHISNIFKEKELDENSVVANFATTASDGKVYNVEYFNLDVIISIGYRVKSIEGTRFRIWANKTLKKYLTQGFIINQKKFLEVQSIVRFITEKAKSDTLAGHEKEILDVIEKYSRTWKVLGQYDEGNIKIKRGRKGKYKLNYYACRDMIDRLKEDLIDKKIVGDLFGQEREQIFEGILGNLYQTFGGEDLYGSLEEKAAHLLYFVIKDHPFFDGNKRIGSLLFLSFLENNNFLFHNDGQVKINDKTIVALALLVAASDPKEKEAMVRLTINLIQD